MSKKCYWKQCFRASGFFCTTIGQIIEGMIQNYLEHHFELACNDHFKIDAND